MLMRAAEPLITRNALCDTMEDRADELYRFLLFYRDRIVAPHADENAMETIERLLVVGEGMDETAASAIIEETLSVKPRIIGAAEARVALPSTSEIDFRSIAAPAGLAALAWN